MLHVPHMGIIGSLYHNVEINYVTWKVIEHKRTIFFLLLGPLLNIQSNSDLVPVTTTSVAVTSETTHVVRNQSNNIHF